MSIYLKNAEKNEIGKIKKLFLSAFPPQERPPFFILKNRAKKGLGDMLAVMDGDEFVGFAYVVSGEEAVYLFFLAVDNTMRGRGYGSRVLKLLEERYQTKTLFLAREQLDEGAENYSQRVQRRQFYLKNGFSDVPFKIKEAGVIYDVMSTGGSLPVKEYEKIMSSWTGSLLGRFIDMRLIADPDD